MPNFPRPILALTIILLAALGPFVDIQAALAQAADAPEIGDKSDQGNFEAWLVGVRAQAREKGISEASSEGLKKLFK